MNDRLKAHLDRSLELTHDLLAHLDEDALLLDLPNLPSNRIAGQVWCVIGARESYTEALEAGVWSGFSCSLSTPQDKPSVLAALQATRAHLAEFDFTSLTDSQVELAFGLLEHEIQHHGQLIRFVYANGLSFPEAGTSNTPFSQRVKQNSRIPEPWRMGMTEAASLPATSARE